MIKSRFSALLTLVAMLVGPLEAATVVWKGDAAPIAQVTTCTVGGTIEANDNFTITIGSKSVTTVAGSTTAATVATNIVTAINALTATRYPEFASITWATTSGGAFTATGKTAGQPFTVTLTTTENGGGAADAQTFTQSATTAADGGAFWSTAANWSTGSVPVNSDDVIFQNSSNPCLYGIDQSAVALTSLTIDQSFTGTIGLPRVNTGGYTEYREQYLKIGATTITIGRGPGQGSGRIKINTGSVQTALNIINAGSPLEPDVKSVVFRGTHASNAVVIGKGSLCVANFAGETSTLATLKQGYQSSVNGDTDVKLGSGVTLSSATVTKTGGTLEINSTCQTIINTAGETTINSGNQTTMTVTGGTVRYKSGGTCTTAAVGNSGTIG